MEKKIYPLIFACLIIVLLYTRFINLSWGLPYPFHPDERNMADAITQLHCTGFNKDCFNPHFFAYGQLPLYLAYFSAKLFHEVPKVPSGITFTQAVMALRVSSAMASVLTFIFLMKTWNEFYRKEKK